MLAAQCSLLKHTGVVHQRQHQTEGQEHLCPAAPPLVSSHHSSAVTPYGMHSKSGWQYGTSLHHWHCFSTTWHCQQMARQNCCRSSELTGCTPLCHSAALLAPGSSARAPGRAPVVSASSMQLGPPIAAAPADQKAVQLASAVHAAPH